MKKICLMMLAVILSLPAMFAFVIPVSGQGGIDDIDDDGSKTETPDTGGGDVTDKEPENGEEFSPGFDSDDLEPDPDDQDEFEEEDFDDGDYDDVEEERAGYGDVGEGTWYSDAVQWSIDNNITGITGGCFRPDAAVSRGETAIYIWNMEGRPSAPAHSFVDISEDSQNDAVSWMSDRQITTGTSSTMFSPDDTLTRAQAAAFLHRLAGEPSAPAHPFSDVQAGWQQDPVSWMSDEGITTGTSSTTFSPSGTLTRAHIVTFLYRYSGAPAVTIASTTKTCVPGS